MRVNSIPVSTLCNLLAIRFEWHENRQARIHNRRFNRNPFALKVFSVKDISVAVREKHFVRSFRNRGRPVMNKVPSKHRLIVVDYPPMQRLTPLKKSNQLLKSVDFKGYRLKRIPIHNPWKSNALVWN